MKLYYSRNLNPRVAVAVARHLDSPVEYIAASPRAPANEAAFHAINPNTLVPVLVEADRTLWETDAIACRLSALAGSDFWPGAEHAAELQMWLSWSAHHFTAAGGVFYFENLIRPHIMSRPADAPALAEAASNLERFAPVLDNVLADRDWLVGGRLSYADFRVATIMPFAAAADMPLAQYRNIRRWADRLNELPAWREPFEGLA